MFGKPKSGQPTRHLFVGNCGPSVGVDHQTLTRIFGQYGTANVTVPEQKQNPRSAFVFVTYTNAEEAAAALFALHDKPCPQAGDRRFTIKHADIRQDQEEAFEQPVALSTESCAVEGLTLLTDFVSEQEEQALLDCAEEGHWETLARRRVCHFGYKFEYQSRNVDPQKPVQPIPEALQPVLERLQHVPDMPQVDQCTVNEYAAGVGLSPHIDTHSAFTGAIASLSLAGGAVMEFRREGQSQAVLLPPRSLLIMAGPARYCWQHYIPHRKGDWVQGRLIPRAPRRMSFTFRQVRGYPCDCQWPEQCDSQHSSLPPTRMALTSPHQPHVAPTSSQQASSAQQSSATLSETNVSSDPLHSPHKSGPASPALQKPVPVHDGSSGQQMGAMSSATSAATTSTATRIEDESGSEGTKKSSDQHTSNEADLQRLEQQFVHDVYNAIAPHFSSTRFAIWPKVRQFIEGLTPGALVADVGCGNGKYFLVRQDIAVLGSDRSSGLAQVAATRLAAGTAGATGSSFKADVAVADGMQLPYASQRFDAVLSIAVLHHITTPGRRIHMLKELLRILRPGGRALVTVWATDQEDKKKIAKWQPIDRPGSHAQGNGLPHDSQGTAADAFVHGDGNIVRAGLDMPHSEADQCSEAASLQPLAAACDAGRDTQPGSGSVLSEPSKQEASPSDASSNDYFVPWHLPFHRAEAAMQVLKANQQADQQADPAAAGSIRIDNKKNSVVFSRYYHVYEQFELDRLVEKVPGAKVLDSFYDKDNWCVVMGKGAVND